MANQGSLETHNYTDKNPKSPLLNRKPYSNFVPLANQTLKKVTLGNHHLWATTTVVLPTMTRFKASCTFRSDSESSADVASSKRRMRGSCGKGVTSMQQGIRQPSVPSRWALSSSGLKITTGESQLAVLSLRERKVCWYICIHLNSHFMASQ
jgi:hypothetical protein